MFYIGPHVSISTSLALSAERAHNIGATGFAIFTRNQRQWTSPPLSSSTANEFKESLIHYDNTSDAILPHSSYLINLGSLDEEKRGKSIKAFTEEMERCLALGLKYLNFHPGSHTGLCTPDECLTLIANSLDVVLSKVPSVMPILEITAGAGSNMGSKLEELKTIIDRCTQSDRLGICIDTCHAFQAGYDISTPKKAEEFFAEVDSLLPNRLRGLHLNDSKAPCGKHLDRHESLGKGYIGLDTFLYIASSPRFENMPLILETPDESLWSDEVKRLLEVGK